MSILIKGMEMPKNCFECPCCTLGYCRVDVKTTEYAKYVFSDGQDNRHSDCPLVEIPTPHGRLIAEKTITEIRYHDADGYHIVNGEQLCELEIDAPTVIEAEGETE